MAIKEKHLQKKNLQSSIKKGEKTGCRAEGDVKINSMKCWLKWTMRRQLLARGGFSSGHQASHHEDTDVTMVTALATGRLRDQNASNYSGLCLDLFWSPLFIFC